MIDGNFGTYPNKINGLWIKVNASHDYQFDNESKYKVELVVFVTNDKTSKTDPFMANGLFGIAYCPN